MNDEDLNFVIDYYCVIKGISKTQLLKRIKKKIVNFTEKDKERLCYFLEISELKVEPKFPYEKYVYYKLKNKVTDDDIAKQLNVNVNQLRMNANRWFNPITPSLVEKIASFLGVDEDEFKIACQNGCVRESYKIR